MIFILLIVIALVAWALHLMQEAVEHREFSLMLAGFLVSVAAAGLMTVYFLVGHYLGYMAQAAENDDLLRITYSVPIQIEISDAAAPLTWSFESATSPSRSTDAAFYETVSSHP